jgi:uncharacterized damage-inducible protein DinB
MKRHAAYIFFAVLLLAFNVVAATAQGIPSSNTAAAPVTGFRASFLKQIDDAEKKLIALSEAVPQEKYSWRPAPGVRSISEVFMHVASSNYFILNQMGVKAPAGLEGNPEKITDKAKVTDSLKRSFEFVRQTALSTSDTDLDKPVNLFGDKATARDVLFLLATHVHEHLGQSIAYARTNGVVPPWSVVRGKPGPGE